MPQEFLPCPRCRGEYAKCPLCNGSSVLPIEQFEHLTEEQRKFVHAPDIRTAIRNIGSNVIWAVTGLMADPTGFCRTHSFSKLGALVGLLTGFSFSFGMFIIWIGMAFAANGMEGGDMPAAVFFTLVIFGSPFVGSIAFGFLLGRSRDRRSTSSHEERKRDLD